MDFNGGFWTFFLWRHLRWFQRYPLFNLTIYLYVQLHFLSCHCIFKSVTMSEEKKPTLAVFFLVLHLPVDLTRTSICQNLLNFRIPSWVILLFYWYWCSIVQRRRARNRSQSSQKMRRHSSLECTILWVKGNLFPPASMPVPCFVNLYFVLWTS